MGKSKRKQETLLTAPAKIVEWKLDKRGKLTVSCEGRMPDYSDGKNPPPWQEVKSQIRTVCLKEGMTEVGGNAFEGCANLKRVIIPWSLRRLHHGCFKNCTSLKLMETLKEAEYRFSGEGFSLKTLNQQTALEMRTGKTQEITFGLNSLYAVPWAIKKWGDFYIKKDVLYACFTDHPAVEIPEGVRTIHTFAFIDADVKMLTLPQTLTRMESFALASTKIEQLLIPGSMEFIGAYAFADSELKKLLFDDSEVSFDGRMKIDANAYARTKLAFAAQTSRRIPEAYKLDIDSTPKEYTFYKKLCIKERTCSECPDDQEKVVFGTVSLKAYQSIFRRLQRHSAIFRLRYDRVQKKVLEVKSWHWDEMAYWYAEHVAEPYYENGNELALKSTGLWHFGGKNFLQEDFSIDSVLKEWDEKEKVRRIDTTQCEEWFWAAGYYGYLRVPELDLLEKWLRVHPDYTI